MSHEQQVLVPARDGYELAATAFHPSEPADDAFVLVPSAMGVPRSFYHPFASYLADQGLPALTVDYRGIGDSAPAQLRGFDADLVDWARLDLAGALDWIDAEHAPGRLLWAGHSVAGQLFGLVPGNQRVERVLTVASVKGHWRLWPRLRHRISLLALWYGVVPTLVTLTGYFPARLSGLGGEDLPAGVARQWCRWGRHRAYMVDDQGCPLHDGFQAYQGKVRAYSLRDDWYAPPGPVAAWLDLFEQAETRHRHIEPEDVEVDAIGHFGFFREPGREAGLWDEAVGWLVA